MNNYFQHQELVKKTKVFLCKSFPKGLRIFDRHVGMFYKKRINNNVIDYLPISINRKGMSDNWAVVFCYYTQRPDLVFPIHLEIETKTGKGKLNPDQILWKEFCQNFGIWFFENRDEANLKAEIEAKAATYGLLIKGINYGTNR